MRLAVRTRSSRVSPCVRGKRLFIVVEGKQVVCADGRVIRHLAHTLNNLSDTGEHRRCVSDAPQLEPLTANVGGFAHLRRKDYSFGRNFNVRGAAPAASTPAAQPPAVVVVASQSM